MKRLDRLGLTRCHLASLTTPGSSFPPKIVLPELDNEEFRLLSELSDKHEWHVPHLYITKEICTLFSLDVRYSAVGEIYKSVRSQNKHTGFVLTTFAVVHCCFSFMNLLSPLSPPFFLLFLHSPPSPPPPPVFPTTFWLFTFSPAPIQGKEESMQLDPLFSLSLFSLWIHWSIVLSQWMSWVVVPSCCHIKHLKASIVPTKYSRHSQNNFLQNNTQPNMFNVWFFV